MRSISLKGNISYTRIITGYVSFDFFYILCKTFYIRGKLSYFYSIDIILMEGRKESV